MLPGKAEQKLACAQSSHTPLKTERVVTAQHCRAKPTQMLACEFDHINEKTELVVDDGDFAVCLFN